MADDRETRATIRALLGAVVAHVVIFAAVLVVPGARPNSVERADVAGAEVEVEVVANAEAKAEATASAEANANTNATASAEANANANASANAETRRRGAEAVPGAEGAGEAVPEGPIALLRETNAPPIGLALGGTNPFLARGTLPDLPRAPQEDPRVPARAGPHAPTNAEAKESAQAVLRAPARERERELGLGPDGPVLAALSEAASLGTTSIKGRAVFLAIADGTGMVVGIDVLECDGGRAGWASAAEAARAALKGKKLRMPSTAKRAEMRIEIVSEWKLPSGHDPGVDLSLLGLPLKKGEGTRATKIELLNPIPKLQAVEIAPGVNVSVPTVSVSVLAVQGDPADIGAKPRRVVHARLLDSKVL